MYVRHVRHELVVHDSRSAALHDDALSAGHRDNVCWVFRLQVFRASMQMNNVHSKPIQYHIYLHTNAFRSACGWVDANTLIYTLHVHIVVCAYNLHLNQFLLSE